MNLALRCLGRDDICSEVDIESTHDTQICQFDNKKGTDQILLVSAFLGWREMKGHVVFRQVNPVD